MIVGGSTMQPHRQRRPRGGRLPVLLTAAAVGGPGDCGQLGPPILFRGGVSASTSGTMKRRMRRYAIQQLAVRQAAGRRPALRDRAKRSRLLALRSAGPARGGALLAGPAGGRPSARPRQTPLSAQEPRFPTRNHDRSACARTRVVACWLWRSRRKPTLCRANPPPATDRHRPPGPRSSCARRTRPRPYAPPRRTKP
jgi:hypothetical protein